MGRGFVDDFTYEVATSQQKKDDLNATDQFGFAAKSPGFIGGATVTPFELAQSSYNGAYVTDILKCTYTIKCPLCYFCATYLCTMRVGRACFCTVSGPSKLE
jgi:hypothetical protein